MTIIKDYFKGADATKFSTVTPRRGTEILNDVGKEKAFEDIYRFIERTKAE